MFLIESLYRLKRNTVIFYEKYFTTKGRYTCILPDKLYLKMMYTQRLGKKINLKKPKTFSEKQNWLKLYDRRPEYTMMADKYKVREYIADKIGEDYLVPLLGVWDSPDDIDFDSLPDKFVFKCNHDNGVIICQDKSKLDIEKTKDELRFRLNRDYYKNEREWCYKNIPRKIICEKYMENNNGVMPIEYKLFCFNGEPKAVLICSNRFGESGVKLDTYDTNWEYLNVRWGNSDASGDVFEEPSDFSILCEISRALSTNIPFVRVDFNLWENKLYFGELTFFPVGGFAEAKPENWDEVFGAWLKLPKKRRR